MNVHVHVLYSVFTSIVHVYMYILRGMLLVSPSPPSICMVSSVTKEGIKDLQERIHSAALNAKDPDTHEHVIGMQVWSAVHVQLYNTCTVYMYIIL